MFNNEEEKENSITHILQKDVNNYIFYEFIN